MGGLYRHPRVMRAGGNLSVQVFVGGGRGVTPQTLVTLALQVEPRRPRRQTQSKQKNHDMTSRSV